MTVYVVSNTGMVLQKVPTIRTSSAKHITDKTPIFFKFSENQRAVEDRVNV
jgi:hypothetical protein